MASLHEALLRHAKHYASVLAVADQLFSQGSGSLKLGLDLFDLDWSNINAGQAWAAANIETHEDAARCCVIYALNGAGIRDLRRHLRESIVWFESALDAAQLLKQRGNEGAILGNLGTSYAQLGEQAEPRSSLFKILSSRVQSVTEEEKAPHSAIPHLLRREFMMIVLLL